MNDIEKRINKMIKKSEVILNAGKQTNEEWLCSISTEEKAKWIAEEKMCRGYFIFPSMEEAIQDALEWLKQPHTNE